MKKGRKRRFLAFLLIACLSVPQLAGVTNAEAKAASIQTASQNIGLNAVYTIVVNNKAKGAAYSFSSSNAKIVTVNKNGKVTGKAYGTAKITVRETKGKTSKKLGTVKITVKKCALDAAVKKGVCAFAKDDGSGVFAGGKGGKAVKSLANIEGLLKYKNPKATYQYVSGDSELLELNENGRLVSIRGSGSATVSVNETYNGKTRNLGKFEVQAARDRKIIAYQVTNEWGGRYLERRCYDIRGRETARYIYADGIRQYSMEKEYDSHGNLVSDGTYLGNGKDYQSLIIQYQYTYENDLPVSVEVCILDSGNPEDDRSICVCTSDEQGRVLSMKNEEGGVLFAYDENGNRIQQQILDESGTVIQSETCTYTADGQLKSMKTESAGPQTELIYQFDSAGYAVSCEEYWYGELRERCLVKGMDLSEYFAKLRADETRDYSPADIIGSWKYVPGVDKRQSASGVLEFFAGGRVVFYDYDIFAKPDASGAYPLEAEGQEMHYELNEGELIITMYDDGSDHYFRGYYLLSGNTIFYIADDYGG